MSPVTPTGCARTRPALLTLGLALTMALAWSLAGPARAQSGAEHKPPAPPSAREIGQQVRQALQGGATRGTEIVVGSPAGGASGARGTGLPQGGPTAGTKASGSAQAQPKPGSRTRAGPAAPRKQPAEEIIESARPARDVHWDYGDANGPRAWAGLAPEFAACASGRRQSPIAIEDALTLRGPAEAIGFDYGTSGATVLNNGHTIQVDLHGDNAIAVRGSRYQLLQLHFHHPSEEQINGRGFAMVAHLVHKDYLGRLAVVAVLLEPGAANAAIDAVWTYMPLGPGDRVRMPAGSVELSQLLPADRRYYQFMGSLTTPPCTEDVLWMVLKQPVSLSSDQLRLFAQQFPNNARPVQPANGRVVRQAQ